LARLDLVGTMSSDATVNLSQNKKLNPGLFIRKIIIFRK
jgi:hypothetical protein